MAAEKRKPTPAEAKAIISRLSQLSHEEKADLAARTKPLVAKKEQSKPIQDRAPQNDDELHAAIIRETGFNIPRVAVCEDHCAPFDPIADGFFHRYPGILIMKSREAGGTLNASILQYMLCKYVPTHEGVTYGAIEAQANKAFCVTADTLIDCPRDHRRYPAGVPISEVRPGQLAWTFNREERKFELKRVAKTWVSHPRAEVWRLILDSGDVIRATPSHRFLTRDNEWVELKDLKAGDSLMPMYRDFEPMVWTFDGKKKEYYEVAHAKYGYPRPQGVVHHLDHYHANTNESNLELIPAAEHNRLHAQARWDNATEQEREEHVRRMVAARSMLPDEERTRIAQENGSKLLQAIQLMSPEERIADSNKRKERMLQHWDQASDEWRDWYRQRAQEGWADKDEAAKQASLIAVQAGRKNQAERVKWTKKRVCRSCSVEKPLALFQKKSSGRGYLSRCLDCYSEERREDVLSKMPPAEDRARLRELLGLSRRQLAERVGVSVGALRRWEYGEVAPRGYPGRLYLEVLLEGAALDASPSYNHKVVSIEPDGYEEVWDMEVEDNHNFVVHGVVLHNSYVKAFTEERTTDKDGNIIKRLKPEIEGEPLRKRIAWKVGSLLSVIIATVAGTNSPHPNTAHADEYDLMDEDVIAQAANMASSSVGPDGMRIPALDIITSTRKSMHGPMQRLIDEIEEANKNGYESSYKLYAFCVGEISEEVPMCRAAPDEQRRARLIELGLDPELKCDCDRVIKSEWSEGVPRTLESVCRGRFFRSRGWMPHDDVKRKFRKNTQTVWEAELECRRPMVDGLYLPSWNRGRFVTNGWMPRPELGPVFTGTDWGGSDLSYVIWSQFLVLPISIRKRDGTDVEIPRFSYVVFDELYDADAGATRLADMVVAREVAWRRQVPGFFVKHRFADMAGKQQRNDWQQHNPPLKTIWPLANRDFDPMVRCLQGLVEDQRYWVDERCSHHIDDIESWRQKNGREWHDESSHSMACSRYLHTSTELLHKRQQRATTSTGDSILPVIVQRQDSRDSGVAVSGRQDSFADEHRWRGKLGGPMPMGWR